MIVSMTFYLTIWCIYSEPTYYNIEYHRTPGSFRGFFPFQCLMFFTYINCCSVLCAFLCSVPGFTIYLNSFHFTSFLKSTFGPAVDSMEILAGQQHPTLPDLHPSLFYSHRECLPSFCQLLHVEERRVTFI